MTLDDAKLYSTHAAALARQRQVNAGREQVADVTPTKPQDDRRRRTTANSDTVDGDDITVTHH